MDFFEHQELARKKTRLLIPLFLLAVVLTVISTYMVALAGSYFLYRIDILSRGPFILWRLDLFVYSALGSASIITISAIAIRTEFNAGGCAVANKLGGHKVQSSTIDFEHRRLLNVVEEMAIASGIPVPDVYIMDKEIGINAFAAGKTLSDAVIGVTRGAILFLNRNELQGIVAHEFSHILNGDMSLNMRLIGPLRGIEVFALAGKSILTSIAEVVADFEWVRCYYLLLPMPLALVFGLGFMLTGYSGLFFGRLIKASVSRQREFLADASAVQFTRYPMGIAGALKKIARQGSCINDPVAEEISYMFLNSTFISKLFATHPPLPCRIRRIDPHWNGIIPEIASRRISTVGKNLPTHNRLQLPPLASDVLLGVGGYDLVNSIGQPGQEEITYSQALLQQFPEEWREAVHTESGAQAMVFALLLAPDDSLRAQELHQLENDVDPYTWQKSQEFHTGMGGMHSASKLALIDLAMPALRRLSPPEYERFRSITEALIANDGRIDLFEFALQKIIHRHLGLYFNSIRPAKTRYRRIAKLQRQAALLLSTLAAVGGRDQAEADKAFREGAETIERETGKPLQFIEGKDRSVRQIEEALDHFDQAAPLVKKQLLIACGKTVMVDRQATSEEVELLRAIADTIGCPVPPFVRN